MGIDDAYHIERVLASGAGGRTELVTLDGSGPFVRKRIPSKLARRVIWAMLVDCDCPRLPCVEATYELPDEFVVVCDYVPGETVEQFVSSRGRLAEKDARQLTLQLCEAAAALHARGVVHRDISPTNVIVAADGAHLIDLGIARFRAEGATHDTTQLGTPGFAAPEQHGFAQTDARSDVYSIGRVLGYLLTGVLPGVPDVDEYERALSDEKVVAPDACAIVRRATAMEPSARYQSAEELARALEGEDVPDAAPAAAASVETPPVLSAPGNPLASPATSAKRRGPSFAQVIVGLMAVVSLLAAITLTLYNSGLLQLGTDSNGADNSSSQTAEPMQQDQRTEPDSSSGTPVFAPTSTDENPLEIVESGWSVGSGGYINYAIALRNNSPDQLITFPTVAIVGRLADGTVAFTQDQIFSEIRPGETIWFGMSAGNGTAPDDVEFSISALEDYNITRSTETAAQYEVSNVSVISGGYFDAITGVVSLASPGASSGGDIAVTAVLRDSDGAIVYGFLSLVDRPDEGESIPFEVSLIGTPEYASYEVYATEC